MQKMNEREFYSRINHIDISCFSKFMLRENAGDALWKRKHSSSIQLLFWLSTFVSDKLALRMK